MINVSNEYLEKINSSSKRVYWYGKVTLKNGTEYDFDTANLAQGQTSITRELCANKFSVGGTCSAELRIAFMLDYDADSDTYSLNGILVNRYDFYEAEITLNFRLFLDDTDYYYEDIFLGTFTVTEPERSRLILTCTAYDYMQKFSRPCVAEVQGTPTNVILSACNVCGVELGSSLREISDMINGRTSIAEYDPKNQIQTWRDVVGYVAAMLCANAVIKNDKLYLIPFNTTTDRYVPASNRVSLTLEDYTVFYSEITAINLRTNIEEKVKGEGDGLSYKFGGNPLAQYTVQTARATLLTNILNRLNALNFVPFNSEIFNDPSFEVGDILEFTENHAENSTKCIITKIELSVNGHMKISCEGDNPYLKTVEESASSEYSEATSGSVGDGVIFYDYVNDDDISVINNEEEEILSITYESNGDYRQEFMAEIKMGVVTLETSTETAYTDNDLDVLATYYLNGQEIATYHPQMTFTDGVSLLHLFYFWNSDVRIPESTFSVTLTASGGSISILDGNLHARIMQSGTAYVEESNEIEYIEVEHEPTKTRYKKGELLDYTGLVVVAVYEDGSKKDITSQCTYSPASGTAVTQDYYFMVDVTYTEDEKVYTTQFDLEVAYIDHIEITHEPNKQWYPIGTALDYTGLEVIAVYDDGATKIVTNDCVCTPADGSIITERYDVNVKVDYTEDGRTYTEYFEQHVDYLQELKVVFEPTKKVYRVGETIDYTGILMRAYFENGSFVEVTDSCIYSPAQGTVVTEATTNLYSTIKYIDYGDYELYAYYDGFVLHKLISIDVAKDPDITEYYQGGALNLAGVVINADYSDDTDAVVTSNCVFTPSDGTILTQVGARSIQVSYTEDTVTKTTVIPITVLEVFPEELRITPPTKTSFKVGENLDYTGVVVTAIYNNGTERDVTSQCTFNPQNGSAVTSSTSGVVTVSYTEGTHTVTDTFDIEVVMFDGIEVTQNPNKTIYHVGEALDLSGTVISGLWSDGSSEDITSQCVFNPSNSTVLSSDTINTVAVQYSLDGNTYNEIIDITVTMAELQDLVITKDPDRTKYVYDIYGGERLDLKGIEVTAYFSDDTSAVVTNACTFNPSNNTYLGITERDIELVASYTFNQVTMTASTTISVYPAPIFKYFVYDLNKADRSIEIYNFKSSDILEDELEELYVPTEYVENGITWKIVMK